MKHRIFLTLLILTLLIGGGEGLALLRSSGTVPAADSPEAGLESLIGTGIWWGKSETLERSVTDTPLESSSPREKI